jgi:hypothetical protein
MTRGDETPRGSGPPDPAADPAPPGWGPAPRRWVPGPSWAGTTQTSDAPAPRRSALTPLPEDDDDISSVPRRSALSPRDDDEFDAVVPRRSALSPLPADEPSVAAPRRSAFTPSEPDESPTPRRSVWVNEEDDEDEGHEETPQLPLPRRSSEYATAARAIQPALPDLGPTPESTESPADLFSPDEVPSPVTAGVSQPSPSVQPTLPDPVLSGPIEAEFVNTDFPPVTVPEATMAAAAVAAEVLAMPDLAELPAAVAEKQELLAEERDMVSEGGPTVEENSSTVGDDTATWLFGSAFTDADHSLYKRPAPGEPETEVDLTPIVIDDPEYDVRKGISPSAKLSRSSVSHNRGTKPTRGKSARRVHVAWRDHKRLLTIGSIVVALLLVVSVGGYLFSRYNPTLAAINESKLTLPPTAGDYRRDPSQGISPSADPMSNIQTVSATYSQGGDQQFVAIAFRPQTDPSAALTEIQARSITAVNGGACGRTTDQNTLACAVVSGATAVLLVTLVDQSPDELIAAAQSVASGIGKT